MRSAFSRRIRGNFFFRKVSILLAKVSVKEYFMNAISIRGACIKKIEMNKPKPNEKSIGEDLIQIFIIFL